MSSNNALQVKAANREWKVVVVDDDRTCLMSLEKMLRICNYKVTACRSANEALSILKDNQNYFDLVIADAYMRDMDGLKFVKHISEQTDLPVIVMSSDDNEDVIKGWFINGVCDYLVKPIRIENVRHVWMNVYRAQKNNGLTKKVEQSWSSSETTTIVTNEPNTLDYQKISDCEDCKSPKKTKANNDDQVGDYGRVNEEYVTNYSRKKQRMIWTPELHQKFVAAFNQLGNLKAVPKKILEIMNAPGLTRENVASHLQKYRQYHKRLEQRKHDGGGSGTSMKAQLMTTTTTLRTMSFHHSQTHQTSGQMAHTEKFHALANESMPTLGEIAAATDVNLAIIKRVDEGNNVIYHPWITYSTEDCSVKMGANCSISTEMDSIRGLGQPCGYGSSDSTHTYENMLDLGYNDDAALYMDRLEWGSRLA